MKLENDSGPTQEPKDSKANGDGTNKKARGAAAGTTFVT